MTSVFTTPEKLEPPPGKFWLAVRAFRIAWPVVHGLLPRPDPLGTYRMRRAAKRLVPLKRWPGMNATSAEVAQLAMMRLLYLQRQTRRAVRGRHREASVMLARSSVETLILGLYCVREPGAVAKLNAGNIKAAADSLAYVGDTGFVPALGDHRHEAFAVVASRAVAVAGRVDRSDGEAAGGNVAAGSRDHTRGSLVLTTAVGEQNQGAAAGGIGGQPQHARDAIAGKQPFRHAVCDRLLREIHW